MFWRRMFRLGGEGAWGDAYGVGIFCPWEWFAILRVSRQRNVVLLVKLKDAPVVVDVDRLLGESGIYYQVWEVD